MKSRLFSWSIVLCLVKIFSDFVLSNDISNEINEVIETENSFEKYLSLSTLIEALQNSKFKAVLSCYEQIKQDFESALGDFSNNLKEVSTDFGQDVKLEYPEIGEQAQNLSENFAKITSSYPAELGDLIKKNKFNEAVQHINDFQTSAQNLDSKIFEQMDKIKLKNSEHGEMAEAEYKEIREKVKSKTENIYLELQNCLEEKYKN